MNSQAFLRAALLQGIFAITALSAWSSEVPDAMLADARLNDVCFVDETQGWAVGERGVIWHTADGGRHWAPQNSGVTCHLASVHFLDTKTGWVAGGFTEPYTHASTGILLRTRDGGLHWSREGKAGLPALERIGFFDPAKGWALGRTSALFPSGVFVTTDAGRSWSPLPAAESHGWVTGDFLDADTGALAGRASSLAVVRRRAVEPLAADFGLRALSRMGLVAPQGGWLVGDGGLILTTADLGKSWQTVDADLPNAVRAFDFSALAVCGSHCWVAGTPGSRLLHSPDAGRSWALCDTGQSLPIHGLTFVNERTGWAVGDLGTILATGDGGRTWKQQQGGGARAAFVGFFGRAADIPVELIARLAAEEGYLGAMEILSREDVESHQSGSADAVQASLEASVSAGASAAGSAWRFPLRQPAIKLSAEQLVELWNQANDAQALEKMEAHIVARIRMWRPSVVFTSSADASGNDPLGHVINQVVLRAVERAADPAQYPDQISDAGLQAWRVQKVYGILAAGQSGTVTLNTSQLAGRLGRSIGEYSATARGVLSKTYAPPPMTIGFRLLVNQVPQDLGKRDFFAGIPLQPGGEARRRLEEVPDRNLDAMRRQVATHRNLQAILSQAEETGRDGRFLADLGAQTRKLDPDRAADVLFQLAGRYFGTGQWALAAEGYELIVERHSDQPAAGPALVWLVQYYASGEAAWRTRSANQVAVETASRQQPGRVAQPARGTDGTADTAGQGGGVRRASHVERAVGLVNASQSDVEQRAAKADGYSKQLEQLHPELLAEPFVRFPLAVAHRQQGFPRQAERYYSGLRHSRPHDAWWACAQTELWLREPQGQPPKDLATCTRSTSKPRLDGRLDEPMWKAASPIELRSAQRDDSDWRAVAMLAYDAEFLYIGVSCNQAPGFKYVPSDGPRPRDPDLSDQDRIELLIDVDRDFATYYRLVIDHRGWTGESCWGDRTWNPTWFVAQAQGDGVWTSEAAIPLSELTGQLPEPKHAWAVGVQRIVPGVGFQSWTTPASAEIIPEGFGILIFQ